MGWFYRGIQKLLAQENGDHGTSLGLILYRKGENKEIVSGGCQYSSMPLFTKAEEKWGGYITLMMQIEGMKLEAL